MSQWVYRILAVVFVAFLVLRMFEDREDNRACKNLKWKPHLLSNQTKLSELPLHCFFSSDYDEGRMRFQKSVIEAGGELFSEPIGYEDLTIDFGLFRPSGSQNDRVIVHLSGTHGVEAFVGNSIQLAILEELKSNPLKKGDATILFVHAVNPFGFRHLRRVNENNVDLNRNFLDSVGWKNALSRDPNLAGYMTLSQFLNPSPPPTLYPWINDIVFWYHNLVSLIKYGIQTIKTAVVAGNYHDASGLGFGGFEKQPSVRIIEDFLKKHELQSPSNGVVMIDVHSGLGPAGVDTLMTDHGTDGAIFRKSGGLERLVEKTVAKSGGAASGYHLTIGTTSLFCERFFQVSEKSPHFCIVEEFGTIPVVFVGQAQIEEMASWRYMKELKEKNASEKELEYATELMKIYSERKLLSFYRRSNTWKQSIVQRGLTLFQDARAHLQKE